jgi:hypothetical protein
MALIINNSSPLTATKAQTATSQIIVSGDFGGNTVLLEATADSGDYAPVKTFRSPGWFFLENKTGTTLRATVMGGNASSIDVSII